MHGTHINITSIWNTKLYPIQKFDFEKCGEEMLKLQKLKYSTNAPHMQSGTAMQIF